MPSRPGEFHPEPLTEPYVNLSIHTARATARRLPPSIDCRAPPVVGCPDPMAMTFPLRSAVITPLQRYCEAVRPSPAHRYFRPRGWSRLRLLPSRHQRDRAQVLTFRTRAWLSFAPPICRMPLGPSQASPKLIPEVGPAPGFDIVYAAFDTSSAVRLRSPPSTIPDRIMSRLFRNVHHQDF